MSLFDLASRRRDHGPLHFISRARFATPCADPACPWVNTARRLTGVAIGGTVSVLITAAAAILGTATIGRSVVAPFFQATRAVGPIGLRRCSRSSTKSAATRHLIISWTASFVLSWPCCGQFV